MCLQTDSGDLLGGFKPVEARDALGPLLQPFMDLTRRTWAKCVCACARACEHTRLLLPRL